MSWRLEPGPNTSYRLVNYFTSKTFQPAESAGGAAVPVRQMAMEGKESARQSWKFIPVGGKFYRIVHAEKDLVLTATAGTSGEVEMSLAPWTGSEEQQWELMDLPEHLTM